MSAPANPARGRLPKECPPPANRDSPGNGALSRNDPDEHAGRGQNSGNGSGQQGDRR
ncbi:hypothetical protein [Frankia sp. CcI49]|uniref:hypothetical protein n=1 Tax=Frankia sp. CcI49 TaxID=1745382 RepID=UPI001304343D|nr:hypothetical protein [Frankia sp. CcI49]